MVTIDETRPIISFVRDAIESETPYLVDKTGDVMLVGSSSFELMMYFATHDPDSGILSSRCAL